LAATGDLGTQPRRIGLCHVFLSGSLKTGRWVSFSSSCFVFPPDCENVEFHFCFSPLFGNRKEIEKKTNSNFRHQTLKLSDVTKIKDDHIFPPPFFFFLLCSLSQKKRRRRRRYTTALRKCGALSLFIEKHCMALRIFFIFLLLVFPEPFFDISSTRMEYIETE
jgi:hypothetical protein